MSAFRNKLPHGQESEFDYQQRRAAFEMENLRMDMQEANARRENDLAAGDAKAAAARKEQLALQQQPGESDEDYTRRMEKDRLSKMSREEARQYAEAKAVQQRREREEKLLTATITAIDVQQRTVTVKHERRPGNEPGEGLVIINGRRQCFEIVPADTPDAMGIDIKRNFRVDRIWVKLIAFAEIETDMKGVIIDCLNANPLVGLKPLENWAFIKDYK